MECRYHRISVCKRLTISARFRWVACQLESLRKCIRPHSVRETLKTLPKTLDETYERILTSIDQEYYREAVSALTWLLFSERPMTLDELAEVMIIDPRGSPAFDPNERLFHPESALNLLSSLTTVVYTKDGRKEIVLAHFSVKEYLTSSRAPCSLASHFSTNQHKANEFIMEGCIQYIYCNSSSFHNVYSPSLTRDLPLMYYACKYWFIHAGNCFRDIEMVSKQRVVQFLEHKESVHTWTLHFDPEGCEMFPKRIPQSNEILNNFAAPLYFAACVGMDPLVEFLMDSGVDADSPGRGLGCVNSFFYVH